MLWANQKLMFMYISISYVYDNCLLYTIAYVIQGHFNEFESPNYLALLIVPCNNRFWMRSAVVAGKYLSRIFVGVFLRESGTVDRGRVTATFRVHEEFGIGDIPRHRAQRFCHELLVRESGIVDLNLMTTNRGTGATYGLQRHRRYYVLI